MMSLRHRSDIGAESNLIELRVHEDEMKYRESVYRARAVVSERLRLAMGLSLRPENKHVHLTAGLEASNISDIISKLAGKSRRNLSDDLISFGQRPGKLEYLRLVRDRWRRNISRIWWIRYHRS